MSLNSSKEEREINSLSKKLNEFYGPFYQLRKKSFTLYKEFRKKFETEDPNFSTLKYLLSGKRFSGNDEVLLNEIILIGEECEDFIHKNAGLIDHNEIRNNLLPKLTTHYRLIKLAKDGMLKGDLDTIGRYTFPKEIDSELENRINEIKARLNELNKKI
ncbi:MAG TPA: hypothetical protein VFM92_06370 [Marivirga sp.]|nr:hypothetical protein [Marivirga sp.]